MPTDFFDVSLGWDFWMFRFGQFISLLGDGCGIAPLLLLVPRFSDFMNASPKDAENFLALHYPDALDPRTHNP